MLYLCFDVRFISYSCLVNTYNDLVSDACDMIMQNYDKNGKETRKRHRE